MKVDGVRTSSSDLILNRPVIHEKGGAEGKGQKTLGEAPPVRLSLQQIGQLASLFAPSGLVGRFQKRLNHLKKKNCKVVPAKGWSACVDDDDTVYLGVDLLKAFCESEPETIAGIMAHEWGHACALKPKQDELDKMNWNEIFSLRRAHESLADEIAGRLLFMMGMKPDGLLAFLELKETHNLKYHPSKVRAQIIREGYEAEKRKKALAKTLFSSSTYQNEYDSILLDIS